MSNTKVDYPIIPAVYEHYKGGVYVTESLATHSETGEVLVIYRSHLFGSIHARPLDMWFDEVEREDKERYKEIVPRFKLSEEYELNS